MEKREVTNREGDRYAALQKDMEPQIIHTALMRGLHGAGDAFAAGTFHSVLFFRHLCADGADQQNDAVESFR